MTPGRCGGCAAHRPSVLRGQLSQDFHRHPSGQGPWNRLALTNLFYNAFTRPDFVAYRFGDREKPAVRLCRKFGMRMAYWTLRSRADVALAEQEGALRFLKNRTDRRR